MSAFKNWLMCCGLLLLVVLTGCNAKSGLDDKTTEPAPPPSNANGVAARIIDATKTDQWVYFNLANNAVVYPVDPDNSDEWDLAFQRFKIKTNSGVSGTGGVRVAALKSTPFAGVETMRGDIQFYADRALNELSDAELISLDAGQFFAVCATGFNCINTAAGTVDRAHLNTDVAAYAMLTLGGGIMYQDGTQRPILGWYNYLFNDDHRLEPAGDTWLIKSVDGIDIKLEMTGYYGDAKGGMEAGNMAFNYKSLTPGFTIPEAGSGQFKISLSASAVAGIAPLAVDFATQATGGTPVRWEWDFGDGTTSTEAEPSHIYQEPGTYVAQVAVFDQRGARGTQSVTIIASAPGLHPPVANAGPDQSILLGVGITQTQVTLDGRDSSDVDGDIVSYVWAGSPKPNDEKQPAVTLGIGRYVFTLTVTDSDGLTASDTVEITVLSPDNNPPTANIVATPVRGVAPLPVQFSAAGSHDNDAGGTIVSYHWDFGDGNTSTAMDPLHTYTLPGHYSATLTVTDDGGAVATTTQVIDAMLVLTPSADTFLYQFNIIGNMPGVDILQVWNHESDHGGRILMDFDELDTKLASLSAGNFTATLKMYTVCDTNGGGGSLAESCPGFDRAASPGGKAAVTTDICLVNNATSINWTENGAFLWSAIGDGSPCVNFTVNKTDEWVSVDISPLVEAWRADGTTGKGLVFTQEMYPVIRDDDNHAVVLGIYSRRHVAPDNRQPYLEIRINQ